MLGRAVTYEGMGGEAWGLHSGDPTTRAEPGLLALEMSAELGAHPAPGRGGVTRPLGCSELTPYALHKTQACPQGRCPVCPNQGPGLAFADFSVAWGAVGT